MNIRNLVLAFCCFAGIVEAHVSVSTRQAKSGASEHYLVRVPTEGAVSTVSVDLEIPTGVTVGEVTAPPGAKYELKRDGKRITVIKWTIEIKPGDSAELSFAAENPAEEATLVWKAKQHFADGTDKDWVPATKLTGSGTAK